MKFASEDLKNEHDGILFGLQILEKMVFLINSQQPMDNMDLKDMVHFLQLFADKCHHGKEEELYFPSIKEAGIQAEEGLIDQLLKEHDEGRRYISHMFIASGQESQVDVFAKEADSYIQLIRSHIEKENQDLFTLGDKMLPEKEQVRLLEAFEDYEEQVMGIGTHDKLHRMLDQFEEKYLSQSETDI